MSAWKAAKNKRIVETVPNNGFRYPEAFNEILINIETQKYQKGDNTSSPIVSVLEQKEVRLTDLEQKKIRDKLYTVNNSHILAMLTVLVCFCMYATDLMPQTITNMKIALSDKFNEWIISPYLSGISEEERSTALNSVNLELQVLKDETRIYSDIDKTQMTGMYPKNASLLFLGVERADDGSVLYHFIDQQQNAEGYIDASMVRIKEANEIVPTSVQIFDKTGTLKNVDNAETLFDGRVDTYIELEQEDVVKMAFSDVVEIRNLYIMNNGLKSGHITINNGNPYMVTFPTNGTINGYIIPVPEENTNLLEIEILSTSGTDNHCAVSELLLCR